jgi:hypothetical protein
MNPLAVFVQVCILEGPLNWQINQLSTATGVQVLFDFEVIHGRGPRVCPSERITANDALRLLLADTPYTWDWVSPKVVAVTPIPWCQPTAPWPPTPPCRRPVAT